MSAKETTAAAGLELALKCSQLADARKGENIVILDMRDVSSIADYFVIVSATSDPHLRAVADDIRDRAKEETGAAPKAIDGGMNAGWIVLDYFDVIVHVMREDTRETFDLESLWGDAPRVDSGLRQPKA